MLTLDLQFVYCSDKFTHNWELEGTMYAITNISFFIKIKDEEEKEIFKY